MKLDTPTCKVELSKPRQELEERLNQSVYHMAYPYGSWDERVRALAIVVGYQTACTTRIGHSKPDDDQMALHRVPVNGQESLSDLVCRMHTAHNFSESSHALAGELLRMMRRGGRR